MAFDARKFTTQKAAENYYGHSWQWICNHKKVTISFQSGRGNGYFIKNK